PAPDKGQASDNPSAAAERGRRRPFVECRNYAEALREPHLPRSREWPDTIALSLQCQQREKQELRSGVWRSARHGPLEFSLSAPWITVSQNSRTSEDLLLSIL